METHREVELVEAVKRIADAEESAAKNLKLLTKLIKDQKAKEDKSSKVVSVGSTYTSKQEVQIECNTADDKKADIMLSKDDTITIKNVIVTKNGYVTYFISISCVDYDVFVTKWVIDKLVECGMIELNK